ncbi:protein-glutamate O-methyltransferase CheR [Geomonas sp. Red32]|uniref:CheR family methyltransferase n=1 Tax=Geomonas sp. Red32 TaxID=2912856 RepID=UPI00254633AC|nr:protein-glutamate O-methyltransferase CheR [Geomonas sp. Red32]
MTRPAAGETLKLFASFVSRTLGLLFGPERFEELERRVAPLAQEAGFPACEPYLLWLLTARPTPPGELEKLAGVLTIGETYFLRDPKSFRLFEERLLPELVAARRREGRLRLTIWSAGCSSGEEPYTIAILLTRLIPDLPAWEIRLVASDLNEHALARARAGIYTPWSFRNAPPWLSEYFTRLPDGRFELSPRVRSMVRFCRLNLAEPSSFRKGTGIDQADLIFCRNVMLYFSPSQALRTQAGLHDLLREGGWLFVAPTEVDHRNLGGFRCLHVAGSFVLEKSGPLAPFPGKEAPLLPPPGPTERTRRLRLPSRPEPGQASSPAPPKRELGAPPAPPQVPPAAAAPAPAPPGPSPEGEGEARYREALDLYREGRYLEAAERCRPIPREGEPGARALALSARALANLGHCEEAAELCRQAIDCDRLSAANHYLLSLILEQQGDDAAAARALRNALFIDHDHLMAYLALGNLKRRGGEPEESRRCFANALRLLERRLPHEVLPEAEGLTAGRLAEIVRGLLGERGAGREKGSSPARGGAEG